MKVSGKGVIVIIFFLVVVPVIADLSLSYLLPKASPYKFTLTKAVALSYLEIIPFYFGYLLLAFTILYLIREYKKISKKRNG